MADKRSPAIVPNITSSVAHNLELAAEDIEASKDIRIELRISGGIPSQSYHLIFVASGSGELKCSFNDQLYERQKSSEQKHFDPKMFGSLLRKIQNSGVLEIEPDLPRFLPDTVVGVLQVSDGVSIQKYFFPADKDQAAVQDVVVPAELEKALDVIYSECGRVLGIGKLKI